METNKIQLIGKLILGFICGLLIIILGTQALSNFTNNSETLTQLAENYKTQLIYKQKALIQRDEANAILERVYKNITDIEKKLTDLRKQGFTIPEELTVLKIQ